MHQHFSCRRILEEIGSARGERQAFALPGTKSRFAPDRLCDVVHIKLAVSVDLKAKTIKGTCSTTVVPINDGVVSMDFDCVEMTIHDVRVGSKSLAYDQTDDKLKVKFTKTLEAGQPLTVDIDYEACPRRGLYFIQPDKAYPKKPWQAWSQGQDEDSRHWYPCYDYPNEKATTEMVVTVAEKYFALSNGRLAEVAHHKARGVKTYHWKHDVPHVSYLVTLAVGEFDEVKDRAVAGVPVTYYVPKGQRALAPRVFGRTPKMIEFFSKKIGVPYPYEKYAQVCVADFIFGGMENTSATTLIEEIMFDKRAALDHDMDGLIAHELAHQWWGDLLTCRDWSHGWLNEGFATYFDALFLEEDKGADEFHLRMYYNGLTYLDEDGQYRRPIVTNTYQEPIDLFDRHLYEKGSCVLHMLRRELGDDLFWKGIRHYASTLKGQCVETPQFRRAMEEATGRSLDRFYTQWVYQAGYPQLKVSYEWDEANGMAKVAVHQTQAVDASTPLFEFPLDLSFGMKKGEHRATVRVSEKEHTFHIPLSGQPTWLSVDPDQWILKTLDWTPPLAMLKAQARGAKGGMERIRAIQGLAKHPIPESIQTLEEALMKDAFWGVQAEAAKSLGLLKTDPAFEALVRCRKVKHPKARRAVAAALGGFKKAEAVKALAPLAAKDASYFVEASAVAAMGRTRRKEALPHIRRALKRGSWNHVLRSSAIAALAEFEDLPETVKTLKASSAYGQPWQVRSAAVAALGRVGEGKKEVREHLSELLTDPHFRVKMSAIPALVQMRDVKAVGALGGMAHQELDGRLKRRAQEAVRQLLDTRKVPDELKRVKEELDKSSDEQRQMKARLDKLELLIQKKGKGGKKGPHGKKRK